MRPVSIESRKLIANAGEIALPYLAKVANRSLIEDLCCLVTLFRIQSEETFPLIIDYFKNPGKGFIESICNLLPKLPLDWIIKPGFINYLLKKRPDITVIN